MPSVPMMPAHERAHVARATEHFARFPEALRQRWARAVACVEQGRVSDGYLVFNELLKARELDVTARTHIQLQAVRCLRDAPIVQVRTELALIEPQDDYQTVVLDYRLGWLMRHRLSSLAAAHQYFDKVREDARRLGQRTWEIAALLQKSGAQLSEGHYEQASEGFMRVYNLSRRNGYVEYIPKALMYKGYALVKTGNPEQGEESLQKAYELACRNGLVPEQGIVLHMFAQIYHHDFRFYGLALEYYEQARQTFQKVPVWPALVERLEEDAAECHRALAELDIAKILGPIPINRLRQEYLTGLVNGFVGIPGIENRAQLGERIGLTRQAIHRNILG